MFVFLLLFQKQPKEGDFIWFAVLEDTVRMAVEAEAGWPHCIYRHTAERHKCFCSAGVLFSLPTESDLGEKGFILPSDSGCSLHCAGGPAAGVGVDVILHTQESTERQ